MMQGTHRTDNEERATTVNLGRCDVCMRVSNARVSREYYAALGFDRAEGDDAEGWAVVTNGHQRLGLFESRYMTRDIVSLNFRGGDVIANVETLARRGISVESGPRTMSDGGCSASLRDPDGYLIFLDTAPNERWTGE